jgi:hypothetical protein
MLNRANLSILQVMVQKWLLLLLLLPTLSHAQDTIQAMHAPRWRVELSGGIAFPQIIGDDKKVHKHLPYPNSAPYYIPTGTSIPQFISGLKVMRRDSSFEYGLGVQALNLKFRGPWGGDTSHVTSAPAYAIDQDVYLARPAIPLTAFFNYHHHINKAYAFVGLSAGCVFAQGRETKDVGAMVFPEVYDIYFRNGVGYVIGGQLGFRCELGHHFDVGAEVSANYVHLPLKQGTSELSYTYNLFYFPVKGYLGYSFGKTSTKEPKQAPAN